MKLKYLTSKLTRRFDTIKACNYISYIYHIYVTFVMITNGDNINYQYFTNAFNGISIKFHLNASSSVKKNLHMHRILFKFDLYLSRPFRKSLRIWSKDIILRRDIKRRRMTRPISSTNSNKISLVSSLRCLKLLVRWTRRSDRWRLKSMTESWTMMIILGQECSR